MSRKNISLNSVQVNSHPLKSEFNRVAWADGHFCDTVPFLIFCPLYCIICYQHPSGYLVFRWPPAPVGWGFFLLSLCTRWRDRDEHQGHRAGHPQNAAGSSHVNTPKEMDQSSQKQVSYYFVDEAGDLSLFDRRGRVLLGTPGVSKFIMVGAAWLPNPELAHQKL